MADVTLVIDGDTAKAVRELAKLAQEQKRLNETTQTYNKTTKEGSRESKGMSDSLKGLSGTIADVAKGATGMLTAWMSIDGIVSAVQQWDAALDGVAKKQREIAAAQKAYAAESAGSMTKGQYLQNARDVAAHGKAVGIGPGDMAGIYDTASDIAGNDPALRKRTAQQLANLRNLGVEAGAADEMQSQFMGYGKSPEQAAALALKGAQLTELSPTAVAKVSAAGDEFKSPEAALAVAGALRRGGGVTPKEIASVTESVGTALTGSKASDKLRRMYKAQGLDYDTLSVDDKIRAMATLGGDAKSLKKRGLSEAEAAAMAKVIPQAGLVQANMGDLSNLPDNLTEQQLSAMYADPVMAEERKAREAKAGAEFNAMYGPNAERARALAQSKRDLGAELNQGSITSAYMVNQDTGEANWLGRGYKAFTNQAAMSGGPGGHSMTPSEQGGSMADPENTSATEKNTNSLDLLRKAIESMGRSSMKPVDRNGGL